jgi:tRNA dimethylallyltransferase
VEQLSAESPCRFELISADSMQVYRGMDIGTAKPSPLLQAKIPHHLIDICEPNEQFTAGDFVRCANAAVDAVVQRGALPVICGGTGFYLKNLLHGLPESPPSDPVIRQTLKETLRVSGVEPLLSELADVDPTSAARIHRNDTYRLLRALEVFKVSKKPLSSYATHKNTDTHKFLVIELHRPRETLYQRIAYRTEQMFNAGLVDEVFRLYRAGYTPCDPGLRAIGYREFFEETAPLVFKFVSDRATVSSAIVQNTRHYVKRQTTYFKSIPDILQIDAQDNPVRAIHGLLEKYFYKDYCKAFCL